METIKENTITISTNEYKKLTRKAQELSALLDYLDLAVIHQCDTMNEAEFKQKFSRELRVSHSLIDLTVKVRDLDIITGQEWEKYINNHIEE